MTKIEILLAGGALLSLTAAALPPRTVPGSDTLIEKDVVDAIQASRSFLRTLRSFELRAEATADEVIDDDTKVELINQARYDFVSPNKLFIDWRSDRQSRQLYYDGTNAALISPRTGYYATAPFKGTVADMLTDAADRYGIIFPLPDILVWAVSDEKAIGVQRATRIGYARIDGIDTDQYFIRQEDVDWQIWIQRGPQPLPRKIVITDRGDPALPKFSARLAWNLNPVFPLDQFTFRPPAGTAAVQLIKVNQEPVR